MVLSLLLLLFLLVDLAVAVCHEPTVAHPLPKYDANHPILRTAFTHLEALLTIAVAEPEYSNTSFSVEITSSKQSLWSYHHTALQRNASRPDIPHVNGDALYRIASITKSFTVLAILQQHVAGTLSLDDPVDKYIEELKGEHEGDIPWKDITLRSLASQLSGIPREFAQSDFIDIDPEAPYTPEELGLPPISREGLPNCHDKPCTSDDMLRTITKKHPVFAPNQQSTYSNVAFEILGLVIENVTNQTYESYINDRIFKPLNMAKSTLSTPPDSAGVIPLGPHYWGVDEGIENPTGGIYSSTSDLSKYLRYILTHYNAITTSANWMHPVSSAPGLNSFYGMPWEIFHTDRILLNSRRTVRFVTKGGGLPAYTSVIMTVPEYDLGITILVGGSPGLFPKLNEIVTVQTVRAAEQLAILQLQQRYAGQFFPLDPSLNSTVTLVADHRGLVIEKFISNSTDFLGFTLPRFLGDMQSKKWYAQLVPTLLYRNESAEDGERWRFQIVFERNESNEGERDVWDNFCATNIDLAQYGGRPINEAVLWRGPRGRIDELELTGFRVKLGRIIFGAGDDEAEEENLEL